MKQPELGKKIFELRKAKGLTQEELVEMCNLSVRTLIRIESGEVMPRSYTIKTIFTALDFNYYNSSEDLTSKFSKTALIISKWLEQHYKYVVDLFNLKTNTMKKISILSITLIAMAFGLFVICSESNAQKTSKVKNVIDDSNKNFVRWFNAGNMDSLVTLYRDDACLVARGCGKEFIHNYYLSQSYGYKFKELKTISVTVSDSIAIEKGLWVISLNSGQDLEGEFLTEWRYSGKKWLMVNDIAITK